MNWWDKLLNSQYVMIGLAGLAFLIALWLVIVIARMLSGGRLRFSGGRTRQARLGIVDAFDLDRQRQLIIVRRDNTEHLIMIGGPNDVVIESEILRVEAREGRRSSDKADGFGDARIPAPTMDSATGLGEEPMLPMPVPAVPTLERPATERPNTERPSLPFEAPTAGVAVEPLPPRTPTFPLPRRPAAPPERRPPPPPESVSRSDQPAPLPPSAQVARPPAPPPAAPVAPAFVAPAPAPAPSLPDPAPDPEPVTAAPEFAAPIPPPPVPASPAVPADQMRPAAVRPPPPSFLKPLPPRPPIRPLRRATPLVPGAPAPGDAPITPQPLPSAEPSMEAPEPSVPVAEVPTAPPHETQAPPVTAPPVIAPPVTAPPLAAKEEDALESLEEEMAKLLGRG